MSKELVNHLKKIRLYFGERTKQPSLRQKAFEAFSNPDKRLVETIKNLRAVRSQEEAVFNCGPCNCYPCGTPYMGNTFTEICHSCEGILNSRFSHLYDG